jgi:hypothetical protein
MFWQFNQAPIYTNIDRRRSSSTDKHVSNLHQQQQPSIDINRDPVPYKKRYRTNSIHHRTVTLMSIKEENETELVNCK